MKMKKVNIKQLLHPSRNKLANIYLTSLSIHQGKYTETPLSMPPY